MSTEREGPGESIAQVRYMTVSSQTPAFLPWTKGERATQTLIKLVSSDGVAFLDIGHGGVLEPKAQQQLLRLTNSGWAVEGRLRVEFDGHMEESEDDGPGAPLEFDMCTLELGRALLALVDPAQGSPILMAVNGVRRDLVDELGFAIPGVRVRDRLGLPPTIYRILVRGCVAGQGEVFLDRFLALGTLEQLSALRGWSTVEPGYRTPAKWILPEEREAAEQAGCVLISATAVIATHLRETLKSQACALLGLQETYALLARLALTHPVVAAPFLQETERVRALRCILHRLISDGLSIHDLPFIVETAGDCLAWLEDTDEVVEAIRRSLARQLTARCLDDEGVLRAFVVADAVEEALEKELSEQERLVNRARGKAMAVRSLEEHWLCPLVRDLAQHHQGVLLLLTRPEVRFRVQSVLESVSAPVVVLSLAELAGGTRVEILGSVDFPKVVDSLGASPGAAPPPSPEVARQDITRPAGQDAAEPVPTAPTKQPFWKSRKS